MSIGLCNIHTLKFCYVHMTAIFIHWHGKISFIVNVSIAPISGVTNQANQCTGTDHTPSSILPATNIAAQAGADAFRQSINTVMTVALLIRHIPLDGNFSGMVNTWSGSMSSFSVMSSTGIFVWCGRIQSPVSPGKGVTGTYSASQVPEYSRGQGEPQEKAN